MITHYGYTDGSGRYYVSIDAEKCNACGDCIKECPRSALELSTVMIDIEDKTAAVLKEEHRKKLKYTCALCSKQKIKPCVSICKLKAINTTWEQVK
jgi:ferredoxin